MELEELNDKLDKILDNQEVIIKYVKEIDEETKKHKFWKGVAENYVGDLIAEVTTRGFII